MLASASSGWRYEACPWPASGPRLGDVGGVAADAAGNLYVFSRCDEPLSVFSAEGTFLRSWGRGLFVSPHGVRLEADGFLYLTDDGDHTVRKCSTDGRVVLELGVPGAPAPFMSGMPFNRCTHTALSPDGDIWVADGYGNGAIHKFSDAGRHLLSFGRCGSAAGEFYVPHNLACDAEGRLYVADRENHRIQLFDRNGGYLAQWTDVVRPMALHLLAQERVLVVGEGGPVFGQASFPNLGPRISFFDLGGRLLYRLGTGYGLGDDEFLAPHGICTDAAGDLYVGEVANAAWRFLHPGKALPDRLKTVRKFRRVGREA